MKVSADFCLIPMGDHASIAPYIASVQRILTEHGVAHQLHAYGTNVEGDWDRVMTAIKACHELLHESGVLRISTSIRVGTRIDRSQTNQQKIEAVTKLL
ncbi:MTH1187 family thiamine-binding protein [uncultured Umboniibacter sp.]|uniref:MTH1187 family thiamine-binding protein n=1 Tax=uncultured Umboniibacter sp. TaxID=1798917 RepID=UPI00262823AB|nr:MTH1187 family thiamine-binding protein [uncultured Umboniibacter sp.]